MNKSAQKFLIEKGYDKSYPLWKLGIKAYFCLDNNNIAELCGIMKKGGNLNHNSKIDLKLFSNKCGIYEIKDILADFYLLYQTEKNYKLMYTNYKFNSRIFLKKDMDTIFLICMQPMENTKYNKLCIYQNNDLIFEDFYISKLMYIGELKISYSKYQKDSNNLEVKKLDISSKKITDTKFAKLEQIEKPKYYTYDHLFDNAEYVKFYFSYSETKNFYVLFDYVKKNADAMYIIENDFDFDNTINYEALFKRDKKEAIEYCFYLTYFKEEQNFNLLNYPLYTIMDYLYKTDEEKKLIIQANPNFEAIFKTIQLIKQKLKIENNDELRKHLLDKYGPFNLVKYDQKKYSYLNIINIPIKNGYYSTYFRNKYDNIVNKQYEQLILNNKVNTKWKSERTLFMLIKNTFSDAIYQYRTSWLKKQSLDIFIPSLNVAFEYQGLQHYEAVDYFGGVASLLTSKERDKRKFELCKKNNIKLIYWNYDEDITFVVLKEKLNNIGISIENCYLESPTQEFDINYYNDLEIIKEIRW